MKIFCLQIICLLFLSYNTFGQSPSFKTYINPVIPGDHPDPTLTKIGSYFYTSGSSFNPTPKIYRSTDLVHWEVIAQPVSATWTEYGDSPGGGIWGGHMVYYNNKYWHFFGKGGGNMYFVTANQPEGPWSSSPVRMNAPSGLPAGLGVDNSIFIDEDTGKWYLLTKAGKQNNHIVELGQDGQPNGVVLDLTWLNPNSEGNPSPWASETGANGIEFDDGNLHHMVSTIDGENITLYIDGQLQTSSPLAVNNTIAGISTNFAYLAKAVYQADPTWKGEILEFNIYNKALSSDEILFLFNESSIYADDRPVVVEAESGELGSFFSTMQDGDVSYITTTTNYSGTGAPGDSNRVATYQVTFQDTGYYSLFARLRVGAGSFNDDSYFYGRGFGEKNDTASADWVFINGLAAAGFSDSSQVVYEPGATGTNIWKWVNVTRNTYSGVPGDSFYVSLDSLTKTFQIASREDGLDFDKIAFGKSNLFYTVKNLDNREPGHTEIPGPDTTNVWNGPPLASNQPKFVGNIYSTPQIEKFEAYWNQVTPENAGKWGSVEATRDVMNWGSLDAAYNFAKDNGFPFHFHVLVWGAQQPSWINNLSPQEQLEEIREWFEAVAARYSDIDYLEVVNEALQGHNPPDGGNGRANYKEALGGNGKTGWDWVLNAFRMAREIFPEGTRLMLNDFSIINGSTSTATYLNIIRLLKAEGLIDIIAEQGHAFTTTAAVATMSRNLDSLAATGIPIQITELDIDGTDDQVQLQSYKRIFPLLYEHPGVEGITLWGWRRGLWRDNEGAYLINQNGSERPSMVWLREYLDSVSVNPVAVEDIAEVPHEFHLYNNYPNPFNPVTTISFNLPVQSNVSISLIDILGRVVKEVVSGTFSSGLHNVTLNASDLSSGVYFYKIEAGNFTDVKKLVLMK